MCGNGKCIYYGCANCYSSGMEDSIVYDINDEYALVCSVQCWCEYHDAQLENNAISH